MNNQYLLNNRPNIPTPQFSQGDERFFPLFFPFLTGALIGGAAVGLTRPRPVFVTPTPYPAYRGYGYQYGGGYSYGGGYQGYPY